MVIQLIHLRALCEGTYDIVVTDVNGCSTSPLITSFTLDSIEPIVVSGTVSNYNSYNVSCNGGSDGVITASAIGGTGTFTYSIDGINFQSSAIFSGLTLGTYTMTYKDSNGCIETEIFILNEPPALSGIASVIQMLIVTTQILDRLIFRLTLLTRVYRDMCFQLIIL